MKKLNTYILYTYIWYLYFFFLLALQLHMNIQNMLNELLKH